MQSSKDVLVLMFRQIHVSYAFSLLLNFLPFSKAAGNAVKRASDNLVRAAQKAAFGKAEDDDVVVKTKFVGGIAQVGTITPEIKQGKTITEMSSVTMSTCCIAGWTNPFRNL